LWEPTRHLFHQQTLVAWRGGVPAAFRALTACLRSDPGAEPRTPYVTLTDGAPFLASREVKGDRVR
jgi:hypothetical protein